ncbi:MAG TPA: tetratricopeptide repeat protein [Vicinamibacterales bacterium]|nr:tetratricopeptide repeat protein [Vicinamibacterales bacterium]
MFHPGVRRTLTAAVLILAAGTPAAAQTLPTEPVAEGYHLLYSGDKAGAVRHFKNLLAANPDDLPRRFGLLMAERARIDRDAPLRPAFERDLDALVEMADTRYGRTSADTEALFYAAQGHMMRAEYRVSYDKGMWGAARDGAKAKGYIDAFVKKSPETGDGYLVLGLYNYYVDIAPTLFHVLRFILFLPPGNRVEGLKQLERAAAQSTLFGPQAAEQLVEIYSGYEGRGADALAVARKLQQQFPLNDDMATSVAELYAGPMFEDRVQAAAVYQSIIDRRKGDRSVDGEVSYFTSVLALASVQVDDWRVDNAVSTLTTIIDAPGSTQDWVLPTFLLRRANYRGLQNDPAAGDDPKRVLASAQMTKWHASATSMLKWIDDRRASGEAAIYASLLPGNRLVVEGKWDEARQAYEPVRARDPQNQWVRYRLAWLDFLRGRPDQALPVFTALADGGKTVQIAIRASALLYMGRTYDLTGRREEARKAYQKVVDDYETQGRTAAAARSGLLTPYRRPSKTYP